MGPWKEWIEVQGKEGQRHFEKTLICCFPRAHDFPPRMREPKGVMGHRSQGKEKCNILVWKDDKKSLHFIYIHNVNCPERSEAGARTHMCHIKACLTLPGITKEVIKDRQ